MAGMGEEVSGKCGRADQISGIPHSGLARRVPLVREIIARRTEGTAELDSYLAMLEE